MNTYGERFDSSVEIAHTYVPELLTPHVGWREEGGLDLPTFEQSSDYHKRLAQVALSYSKRPILLGFIDDIGKSEEESFMTELSVMEGLQGSPDVYFESDYIEPAKQLIERIRGSDLPILWRLSDDMRKTVYGTGKTRIRIPLVGFSGIDDPEHPSCQVLDLAWTIDRLQSIAPDTATILPENYSAQQMQVAALARLIPEITESKVTTILTDDVGRESNRFVWELAN